MDVRSQTYFITLAEQNSLLKAAKALGISQPALSAWLNNLETELDTQLVIRSRTGIILTPAGRVYLEGSRKMIAERDRFYREARQLTGVKEEVVRIGGTASGGVRAFARLYRHFKTVMPSVTLQFVECYNRDMLDYVKKGKIDFGIGSIADPDIPEVECMIATSREHVLLVPEGFDGYYDPSNLRIDEEFPKADLDRFRNVPFIMPSEQVSFYEALNRLFEQADYRPNIIFQTSNTGALYSMIKAGNGIGVVSRTSFSPLDHVAPYSFDPPFLIYGITAYKKGRILTKAEQEVLNYQSEHSPGSGGTR